MGTSINFLRQNQYLHINYFYTSKMNLRIFTFILIVFMISWETISFSIQEVFINANVSPLVNLVLVYDSLAPNGQVLKSAMENIAKKREGFFKVQMIDCE